MLRHPLTMVHPAVKFLVLIDELDECETGDLGDVTDII